MMQQTLQVKQSTITLPSEWTRAFPADSVIATWIGDVLMIRPIEEVRYPPQAEQQALDAIAVAAQEKKSGTLRELGNKTFQDLKAEAEMFG